MIKNVNFRLFLYKNVTEEPSDQMSLKYRVMKTENGMAEGRRVRVILLRNFIEGCCLGEVSGFSRLYVIFQEIHL